MCIYYGNLTELTYKSREHMLPATCILRRLAPPNRPLRFAICNTRQYSEPLARKLIEKIEVYDEKLVIKFKSG